MFWYVLFVKTSYEHKVVNEISNTWKLVNSKPYVPLYEAHFKRGGRIYPERRMFCPGYVFVESEMSGSDFYRATRKYITLSEHTFKLLCYSGSETFDGSMFEMKKDDYMTFMQLYNDECCIEMSKGFLEGDSVCITDGSLKGFESRIVSVRPSKLEAIVEVQMFNQIQCLKVGLEILKKM